MRTADFDYVLPPELIAQQPAARRDESRLLVLDRKTGGVVHRKFPDLLEYLKPGDVLVLNNSRVIPARLRGINARTGGRFEMLLLEENAPNDWWVMLKPGKRARLGTEITLTDAAGQATDITATVTETNEEGHRRLCFSLAPKAETSNIESAVAGPMADKHRTPNIELGKETAPDITRVLDKIGEIPLPPYIARENNDALAQDWERYQTVYAAAAGSVAAPTAGLHFTDALLHEIRQRGVHVHFVTLHVGLGTFAPVKADDVENHVMHEERFEVGEETARAVNEAKAAGRRVVAVGTTTVRVLESVAAQHGGKLAAGPGRTRIFLYPPAQFQIVDALLTNFHLPRSTLLMLVSAFAGPGNTAGRDMALAAYQEAIRERYRFFSYGDAMLIL
jgi:S-adenosylmethionine:tRNA ribosyltransferase-isomerase